MPTRNPFRDLPSVDSVLADDRVRALSAKYSGDTASFKIEYFQGAADPAVMVKGTFKRSETPYTMSAEEAAIGLAPASDMMKKIHGMVGHY